MKHSTDIPCYNNVYEFFLIQDTRLLVMFAAFRYCFPSQTPNPDAGNTPDSGFRFPWEWQFYRPRQADEYPALSRPWTVLESSNRTCLSVDNSSLILQNGSSQILSDGSNRLKTASRSIKKCDWCSTWKEVFYRCCQNCAIFAFLNRLTGVWTQ